MVLFRFSVFVSLADIAREDKRAKGYQVVTLAEQVLIAAGNCMPTVMFTLNSCSGTIAEIRLF
jgi:hypothetical protein